MLFKNNASQCIFWNTLLYFTLLYFTLLGTSCVRTPQGPSDSQKIRGVKHTFIQGSADHLYNIESFRVMDLEAKTLDSEALKDKSITLKTSKAGKLAKNTVSTAGIFIDPDSSVSFVNHYQLLDYKVLDKGTETKKQLADLLGKVDAFKGFPDTEYQIVPHLLNNYLILYRLSEEDKLPYDEKPLAIKIGDKLLAPLVGYSVQYCVAEVVLNANKEETGEYRPSCEGTSPEKAEYVQFRKSTKEIFKYLPKEDVFPADFFKGEWFSVESIVKSAGDRSTGFHNRFIPADLIEFIKTPSSLEATETSAYELDSKDQEVVAYIPVEWAEYELDRDSDVIYRFGEKLNTKTSDVKRPYFRIKFQDLLLQKNFQSTAEVDSVFITDAYFSFTVRSSAKNRWIKFSFKKKKKNSNYVEKQWFESDSKLFFPAYHGIRKYYQKAVERSQEDRDRYSRTNRFNLRPSLEEIVAGAPKDIKTIKWYFSKQTPKEEWVRDFGRKAVKYWDVVFQKAGENSDYKIRIVLDETQDRELGDIRYNIINLMMPPSSKSNDPLGYGPNIADPITGEIISTTANVWVNNIIGIYIGLLKKYIRFQVYPPAWKILPESYGVSDFIHKKIQKLCPEVVQFIAEEKEKGITLSPTNPPLKDNEVVEQCARSVSAVDILTTTLHEMGHGFSYRHMFSASADKENFYQSYAEIKEIFGEDVMMDTVSEETKPAQFSSVMDYPSRMNPQLLVPGKYDIAITRFVYFDQIEKVDGDFVTIPSGADSNPKQPQKSIQDTLKSLSIDVNTEIKKYKVCGGKKYDAKNSDMDTEDPLCARWDYGSTPLEVVTVAIRDHYDSIMRNSRRYDDEKFGESAFAETMPFFRIINSYSEKWFDYQSRLLKKSGFQFYQHFFLNEQAISQYKTLFKEEAKANKDFRAYYQITEPLHKYFKYMYFMPVKHCVYKLEDGSYKAVAAEIIELRVSQSESRELFIDCQSPVVQKWASKNIAGQFLTEVGYFGNHKRYFLNYSKEDPMDEASIFGIQLHYQIFPSSIDKQRQLLASPIWHITASLASNFFDNPVFAKDMVQELKEYLLEGQDLNSYVNKVSLESVAAEKKDPLLIKGSGVELPRTLSYEVDRLSGQTEGLLKGGSFLPKSSVAADGLMGYRDVTIIHQIAIPYTSAMVGEQERKKLKKILGRQTIEKNFLLKNLVDGIYLSNNSTVPFIYELYKEYESSAEFKGIESFPSVLFAHPETCEFSEAILLPLYSAKEGNLVAELCKKFNEYMKCITTQGNNCEDFGNKRALIDFVQNRFVFTRKSN